MPTIISAARKSFVGQAWKLASGTIDWTTHGARLAAMVRQRGQGRGIALKKRRRSKRLPLSIPVCVYGHTPTNHPFRDNTVTTNVSAYGGVFPLAAKVKRGDTILLVNSITDEERKCRVVYTEPKRRGKKKVAVEFTDYSENEGDFWRVYSWLSPLKRPPFPN